MKSMYFNGLNDFVIFKLVFEIFCLMLSKLCLFVRHLMYSNIVLCLFVFEEVASFNVVVLLNWRALTTYIGFMRFSCS